jgi:transcription elongation factor Elf1
MKLYVFLCGKTIDVILTAEHKNYMRIKKRTVNSSWTRKYVPSTSPIHCLLVDLPIKFKHLTYFKNTFGVISLQNMSARNSNLKHTKQQLEQYWSGYETQAVLNSTMKRILSCGACGASMKVAWNGSKIAWQSYRRNYDEQAEQLQRITKERDKAREEASESHNSVQRVKASRDGDQENAVRCCPGQRLHW